MTQKIYLALADDHAMVRQSLAAYLSTQADMTVGIEAADGRDLLTKLMTHRQIPDVCLVDIGMPIMDGYRATEEIVKRYPGTRVIACSMFDDNVNIIGMLKAGASGFISKSAGVNDLVNGIRQVYEYGFYSSECISEALKIMMKSRVERSKSYVLNEREMLLLSLLCTKLSYSQIAKVMCLSQHTIPTCLTELSKKVKVGTRMELAMFAAKVGIQPYDISQLRAKKDPKDPRTQTH